MLGEFLPSINISYLLWLECFIAKKNVVACSFKWGLKGFGVAAIILVGANYHQ